MKRIILSIFILTVSNAAIAQTYIIGGLNASNISKDEEGKTEDNNMLLSFNAGLLHQFDLSKVFDLEIGISLTGKGAKAETYFTNNDYMKAKFNPLYMEVPLNAVIKITDVNNNGIYFHGGPYVAVGVGGKSKIDSKIGLIQTTSSSDIKFNNDNPFTFEQEDAGYDKLKRFDYGINAGLGVGGKKAMLRLNYGLGLAKIVSAESMNSTDEKNKFRVLSLNLAIGL